MILVLACHLNETNTVKTISPPKERSQTEFKDEWKLQENTIFNSLLSGVKSKEELKIKILFHNKPCFIYINSSSK